MNLRRSENPFEELYLGETLRATDYVRLFSSFLVAHSLPLFQPGNVVLMGVQGSGKSMLLSLLAPEVRLAYAKAKIDFPVPPAQRQFVSGGINLRRSGAMSFGQRLIKETDNSEEVTFPFYYADFLNHWILLDLLSSVRLLAVSAPALELGIRLETSRCDAFAKRLCADDVWFGALGSVSTLKGLERALQERVTSYLSFLNFNATDISAQIRATKTTIGAPIAATARLLREFGVIGESTRVLVHIDQYEEVRYLAKKRPFVGDAMRHVVNRALGSRDEQVSYKVGARGWAWRENLEMLGTSAVLEQDREYRQISLDELLRRKENSGDWIFPAFAEDVMRRRLEFAGEPDAKEPLRSYFGSRLEPETRASIYARGGVDSRQAESVRRALGDNYHIPDTPLSLKLAQAWVSQQNNKRRGFQRFLESGAIDPQPWAKPYWRKERIEQALLQIAAHGKQRLHWSGREDILALSGGNVLVFVSLCREIWAAHLRWLRSRGPKDRAAGGEFPIQATIQNIGIDVASRLWIDKIVEQPDGHSRKRFVEALGRLFRKQLLDDAALVNPGHNGISLLVDDFEADRDIRQFVSAAVDYGELIQVAHTTKERNRLPRIKWYLRPIFSPFFQLPVARTKEPIYAKLDQLRSWIDSSVTGKSIDDAVRLLPATDAQLALIPNESLDA